MSEQISYQSVTENLAQIRGVLTLELSIGEPHKWAYALL